MPGARVNPKEVDKDEEQYQREYLSNKTHYSTTDTDARVSVKPGKPRQLNHLSQVSVDSASRVITQIQADYADKRDSQCLPSLLSGTISALKQHGLLVEEVLADAGYSSGEALSALEEQNVGVIFQTVGSTNQTEKVLPTTEMVIITCVPKVSNCHSKG